MYFSANCPIKSEDTTKFELTFEFFIQVHRPQGLSPGIIEH